MDDGSGPSEMRSLVRRLFSAESRQPLLALNLLHRHWPDVVGPELGARTEPSRLAGGVLWVATPDACWAYEMQFFKAELLASVQAFLDSAQVREVRFQAGTAASTAPAAAAINAGAQPAAATPTPQTAGAAEPPAAEPESTEPSAALSSGDTPRDAHPAAVPGPRNGGAEPEAPAALARAAQSISDPALRAMFQRSLAKQHRGRGRRES